MSSKLIFLLSIIFLMFFLTGCNKEDENFKQIESIEMHTLPSKTTFEFDEDILIIGAKIKINYNDQTFEIIDITEDMIFDIDLVLGTEFSVVIKFVSLDQTFTTDFKIIINNEEQTVIESTITEYFTISFETYGGSTIDSLSLTYQEQITPVVDPIKEGYVFMGWYTDLYDANQYQFNQMPDYDFTLYAEWMSTDLEYEVIDGTDEYMVYILENKDLEEVIVPRKIDDKLVTKISNSGFSNMDYLTSLKLPSTIKSFGQMAFYNIGVLEEIFIPKDLENIENNTFMNTFGVINYLVDPNNTHFKAVDGILYSFDLETLIRYPIGRLDINEYSLPNTTKIISPYAFSSSYYLNEVILNDGLEEIKTHAFYDANGLLEIIIPNSVINIELYAFRSAMNLSKVELGSGISGIESYVFNNCGSLKEIVLPANISYIRYGAFYGAHQLNKLIILRPVSMGLVEGGLFMLSETSLLLKILVLDQMAVDLYKEATHWNSYQSKIEIYIP